MTSQIDREDIHRGYDGRYQIDDDIESLKDDKEDTMINEKLTTTKKY